MSDELFTMEDAEDDGKIKREAGSQMASVAKRESPVLFEAFEQVCEQRGVSPADILGGKAIRALEDAEYAKELARTDIDLSIINQNEMRVEDVEYVMDLADSLGLNDQQEDPIMDTIRDRIESAGKTPLSEFSGGGERSREVDRRLAKQLEQMDSRLSKMERHVVDAEGEAQGGDDRKEIDDLFDDGDDEPEQTAEVDTDSVEVTKETEEEPGVAEYTEEDEDAFPDSEEQSEESPEVLSTQQGVDEE